MPLRNDGEPIENFVHRLHMYDMEQQMLRTENIPHFISDEIEQVTYPIRATGTNYYQASYGSSEGPIAENQTKAEPEKKSALNHALLAQTTRHLLRKYENTTAVHRPQADRRERDYIALIQNNNQQNKTPREILYSEKPVYVSYLSTESLKQMVDMCPDIKMVDGRIRLTCAVTGEEAPREYAFICSGRVYLSTRVPSIELCASCERTRPECKEVITYDKHSVFICATCLTRKSHCSHCSSKLTPEYLEAGICGECVELVSEERPYRRFYQGLKWQNDSTPGAIMQSNRVFSFEIEAVVSQNNIDELSNNLLPEAGMSGDSSIRAGSKVGVEVQSPLLRGGRGEEFTTRTTGAFKAAEAEVNGTCGMHVHLDAYDIIPKSRQEYPKALIDLWKTHLVFEDVMFSFLPFVRRLNRFCRPMRDYFKVSEIEMIKTIFDAEKMWYKQQDYDSIRSEKQHHHHASRYFGVNFHSLFASNNLELRHHSGTINAKKILQWANLHALIMDAAVAGKITDEFLMEAQATTSIRDKTRMLFELIGLSTKSQQYFLQRQSEFDDKTQDEQGLVETPENVERTVRSRFRSPSPFIIPNPEF